MYDMDAFYGNYLLNGYTYAWLLTTGLNLCTQADIDKLQDKNLEQIQANEALNAILNKISNYYGGASNGYLNFFIVYA